MFFSSLQQNGDLQRHEIGSDWTPNMHPQEKGAHSHILNKSLAVTFTNYAHNLQLTHFSPVSHFYTSPPSPAP